MLDSLLLFHIDADLGVLLFFHCCCHFVLSGTVHNPIEVDAYFLTDATSNCGTRQLFVAQQWRRYGMYTYTYIYIYTYT